MSTLILVTGQHRSGTSATAGCLRHLGVYLGTHLMPANAANPKGYFEDMRVVQLHDRLLEFYGASWDRPGCVPATGRDSHPVATEEAVDCLSGIVREFSLLADVSAIKDPRACLFIPLWQLVCEWVGTRLVLLVPQRLEEATAQSLMRREGWKLSRAAEVVVGYRAALDRVDPRIPKSTIYFPDGLWQASSWERIAKELDVELDVAGGISKVHSFLDYGLVHHG
jgi:hypothetical protein